MVMRRVFNHHVCLCVLSTAILAGLALMTSQTKVYAQPQNCKGLAGGSDRDESNGLIVCDGKDAGSGWRNGVGTLTGNRTIDMGVHSGVAVTITGQKAKIRISSELKVTNSSGSNNNPAIKVSGQGKLTVDNANVTGVKKGIEVSDSGSSVTVVKGTIGVKNGGGGSGSKGVWVKGGEVTMERVRITMKDGGTGVEMGEGVTNASLTDVNVSGVERGIYMSGKGTFTVERGEIQFAAEDEYGYGVYEGVWGDGGGRGGCFNRGQYDL
ncbi:hypothetical protein [Bartonella schoenbuchensis]|uniref:hypothetical protein n=1 Tax=Bartonella schoenbuchensis TaxID=165694 RepID=UPI0031451859